LALAKAPLAVSENILPLRQITNLFSSVTIASRLYFTAFLLFGGAQSGQQHLIQAGVCPVRAPAAL
jgi:hypothetical protein